MKRVGLVASFCFLAGCARVAAPRMEVLPLRAVKNATRLADGDLELSRLRQRVIDEPGNTAARLKLAEHYEAIGMGELAIEHYRLAGEKQPGDEMAAFRHAQALRTSDAAAARAELRRFVASYPVRWPGTYSLLGILEDQAGDLAAGEAMHRRALQLEPKSEALHNNLGFNLLTQGQTQAALAEFQRALKLRPSSALARNNMATALAALAESEKSAGESAVRLAFGHWKKAAGAAEAHNNLAAVYMRQGRYAAARKELESAVRLQPDLGPAWRNLQQLSELDGGQPQVAAPAGRNSKAWRTLAERSSGSMSGTPVPTPEPGPFRTEVEGPEKSLRETIGAGEEPPDAKEQ